MTDRVTTEGQAAAMAQLAERVRGQVFFSGDPGYDGERAGFQLSGAHRPEVVVGAASAADVQVAVEFAAGRGWPVSVQATGHGFARPVTAGVLISTRRMSDVRVDPGARTAWVGAGVRWQQVIDAAAVHGLAPLSGSLPEVGAVSYSLGGGIGLLARRYGYAADQVRRLELVTADGRLRTVTPESEPDLFWALRGGGGNFGVVTGMEVGLVPVARLYGGGLYFDADPAILDGWLRWTTSVPEEMTSAVLLIPFPDVPEVPDPLRGRRIAHVQLAYAGDADAGEEVIAPLRDLGVCLMDTVRDMAYAESAAVFDDPSDPHSYQGTNAFLREAAGAAETIVAQLRSELPLIVGLRHLGGALSRPPQVPSAVGHRDARYLLSVLSPADGLDPDLLRTAHDGVLDAMRAWATGGMSLNFQFGPAGPARIPSGYAPGDYERLVELKKQVDPACLFRGSNTIPDTALGTAPALVSAAEEQE
ncbi:FAD-binding oxidoreductase [Desertihabitans aurantiacus]|uniref:FAD-binding oxidoreductase n=1 Tax=Desertihabitans aurantiacus TaxID=2282477 RepID=UPI000DF7E576|nr:FAD-binding oxidoreductase [Desertihabitans aurantiacus]